MEKSVISAQHHPSGWYFYPKGWCYSPVYSGILQKKRSMPKLTERELTIARLGAEGMTVPQIADSMNLSPETIKWYRKRMLREFSAKNFAELIAVLKDADII